MPISNPIRIILADDHELFRDGFELMLRKQTDIKLVAQASTGAQLVALTKQHLPDLIITDIQMPVMNGVEATLAIKKDHPNIGIIALTMFPDNIYIVEMLEAGAAGYLIKSASKEEIIEAIYTVYNKGNYYCQSTTPSLVHLLATSKFNPEKKKYKHSITPSEKEILVFLCRGLTTKKIAELVHKSKRTVDGYRQRILFKMNVKNTAELTYWAVKYGMVKV